MKKSGGLLGLPLAVLALASLIAVNAKAAATAPSEYDAFLKRAEARLQYLQSKIPVLDSKIQKVKDKSKADLQAKFADFKAKEEKADKDLAALKTAGEKNWKQSQGNVRGDMNEAFKAYRGLVNSSKIFLQEQKEQYERDTEALLKFFDNRIAQLDAQVASLKTEKKKELESDMLKLKEKRDSARKKFDGLKAAGTDKWIAIKADVNKANSELSESYDKIAAKLK